MSVLRQQLMRAGGVDAIDSECTASVVQDAAEFVLDEVQRRIEDAASKLYPHARRGYFECSSIINEMRKEVKP